MRSGAERAQAGGRVSSVPRSPGRTASLETVTWGSFPFIPGGKTPGTAALERSARREELGSETSGSFPVVAGCTEEQGLQPTLARLLNDASLEASAQNVQGDPTPAQPPV